MWKNSIFEKFKTFGLNEDVSDMKRSVQFNYWTSGDAVGFL